MACTFLYETAFVCFRRNSFNPALKETLTEAANPHFKEEESDEGGGAAAAGHHYHQGMARDDSVTSEGDVCAYYFWVIAFFFFSLAILNFLVLVLMANALGIGPYGMAAIEFLPEQGIFSFRIL